MAARSADIRLAAEKIVPPQIDIVLRNRIRRGKMDRDIIDAPPGTKSAF